MINIVGPCTVAVILFDFGGVLAEEGFLNGLRAIAEMNRLNPEAFVRTGFDLVHSTGYVVGRISEATYWKALREATGIKNDDHTLRSRILSQFILRSWMMEVVRKLKDRGMTLGILSDQTNWMDELNAKQGFFKWFDYIFNSYHQGKSKRDPSAFDYALATMRVEAKSVLFVDDHAGNVERAREKGMHTILYMDREIFLDQLNTYCAGVVEKDNKG
jgi:FMN phosphatase YigB (HAD superfamily)